MVFFTSDAATSFGLDPVCLFFLTLETVRILDWQILRNTRNAQLQGSCKYGLSSNTKLVLFEKSKCRLQTIKHFAFGWGRHWKNKVSSELFFTNGIYLWNVAWDPSDRAMYMNNLYSSVSYTLPQLSVNTRPKQVPVSIGKESLYGRPIFIYFCHWFNKNKYWKTSLLAVFH